MTTKEHALGRLFDVSAVIALIDLDGGNRTGNRVHMKECAGVAFLIIADAGSANDDLDFDLKEHNAASGGTSQDLDIVTDFFVKTETTLDGDETWSRKTQSAASEVTDVGGAGTSAEEENLVIVEVRSDQLSDGFEWLSIDIDDLGSAGAKVGGVYAILWGLKVETKPESLPDWLDA